MRLTYEFYNRDVVEVATDLLGKKLTFKNFNGIITETEAYGGYDDEASHAFRGPTQRSRLMFGPPGILYVYMIYGMYFCLNVVTGNEGAASAVLIRGLKLDHLNLDGPGKLCRHLNIDISYNGLDIVKSDDIYISEGIKPASYLITPRIGIKKAIDKKWRFLLNY